jgi:hypothetical protein
MGLTTDPEEARDSGTKPDGQQNMYAVLSEEEREKGFVRPLRGSYTHVGIPGPKYPLRDLDEDEKERFHSVGYVKYEEYSEEESPVAGRYWTQKDLDRIDCGCGAVTNMANEIAETYGRKPSYYSGTFCCNCRTHLPVGEQGEFIWEDGSRVGT